MCLRGGSGKKGIEERRGRAGGVGVIGDEEGSGAVVSVMSEVSVMSAEGRWERGGRGIVMGGRA